MLSNRVRGRAERASSREGRVMLLAPRAARFSLHCILGTPICTHHPPVKQWPLPVIITSVLVKYPRSTSPCVFQTKNKITWNLRAQNYSMEESSSWRWCYHPGTRATDPQAPREGIPPGRYVHATELFTPSLPRWVSKKESHSSCCRVFFFFFSPFFAKKTITIIELDTVCTCYITSGSLCSA